MIFVDQLNLDEETDTQDNHNTMEAEEDTNQYEKNMGEATYSSQEVSEFDNIITP